MGLERPCATVPLVFQYKTVNDERRTDKGGKSALVKQGDRLFLLTVKQLALYQDLGPQDTLVNVSVPFIRNNRGERKLEYRNVIKGEDIPQWTEVDVSDEEHTIPLEPETGKILHLRSHDSVYFLEITGEAWATSPLYKPLTRNTVNVSIADSLRFCSQRCLGTGFLAEYPQWRSIREVEGSSTVYPGQGNEWNQMSSTYQVPPTHTKDCKSAVVTFAYPSSIITEHCYYPPMFLVDVNVKSSACGTPMVNEENELVGLISEPSYFIPGSKELVLPGTWICAVPAGLEFPPRKKQQGAADDSDELKAAQEAADRAAAELLGGDFNLNAAPKKKKQNSAPPKKKNKGKGKKKK